MRTGERMYKNSYVVTISPQIKSALLPSVPKECDNSGSEAPTTRWWESYLVRYFLGFIVGAVCVAALLWKLDVAERLFAMVASANDGKSKPDWTFVVLTAFSLGIGYCYIASTPITVFHYARFTRGWIDSHSRHFWFSWVLMLVTMHLGWRYLVSIPNVYAFIAGTIAFACVTILPVSASWMGWVDQPTSSASCLRSVWMKIRSCWKQYPRCLLATQTILWFVLLTAILRIFSPESASLGGVYLLLLSMPVLWIGFVQYFVLARVMTDHSTIEDKYIKLSCARRKKGAKDIRETYSHLREHSNSIFIVVIELSMLSLLFVLDEILLCNAGVDRKSAFGISTLVLLAIWMVPTVFMWARANAIEVNFANDPNRFLGE